MHIPTYYHNYSKNNWQLIWVWRVFIHLEIAEEGEELKQVPEFMLGHMKETKGRIDRKKRTLRILREMMFFSKMKLVDFHCINVSSRAPKMQIFFTDSTKWSSILILSGAVFVVLVFQSSPWNKHSSPLNTRS